MATRRPARKRSAKSADEGVPAGATRGTQERSLAQGAGDAPAGSGQAEERLLVEAAQRDLAKFDALYEMHFERVYGFVANKVRDRATAEDLTSEVFHKALANLAGYEWRGVPFAAWLLRIATNAVADQWKRAARELPAPDDPPEPTQAEVRVVEDRARLFRMVAQLPEAQRQVVRQRFVEQRSIREIAERLGKTEGAIKQLQLRALERLRAQMGGSHA
ncbi:MAG TPA: sigma-70 family RNA polymerase sigma factor [Candidatus Acidoferrum sp.]|nr:sigma-70 family RNA polymerase sigma factor [Candidatus Acidoferrum sp.]